MSERFLRCVKVPNNKKFCFKIWKTATETYQLQQAYGADAIGRTQVFGSVNVKRVEPQLKATPAWGRPSTSRNEEMIGKVGTIVRNNTRLTV